MQTDDICINLWDVPWKTGDMIWNDKILKQEKLNKYGDCALMEKRIGKNE